MVFYRCTDLVAPARPRAHDPDEQIAPRAFTVAEIQSLVQRRKIIDMKTILGLGLVEQAARAGAGRRARVRAGRTRSKRSSRDRP
jgi:hypothetical protein